MVHHRVGIPASAVGKREAIRVAGGVQSLAQYTQNVITPDMWWEFNEVSGSIGFNSMYTGGVGPELVTNGDMSSSTGWSLTAPWTISGGKLVLPSNPGASVNAQQSIAVVAGSTYRYEFDVDVSDGRCDFSIHGALPILDIPNPASPPEHYTLNRIYASGSLNAGFRGQNLGSPVQIDNFSVKKIGQQDLGYTSVTVNQAGLIDGAVACDGAASVGQLINVAAIQGLTAFTLYQLINPDTLTNGDYLWFKLDSIEVWLNADGSVFARVHFDGGTDAESLSDTGVVTTGAWHAVYIVLDGLNVYIYVNGELVNATTQPGVGNRVSNANHWQLWKNAGANAFDGFCDDAWLKSAALSPSIIATHANLIP